MSDKMISLNNESNYFICSKCCKNTKHNLLNIIFNLDENNLNCYYMVDINSSHTSQYHLLEEINEKNYWILFKKNRKPNKENNVEIYIKICSECGNRVYIDWDSHRKTIELANQNMIDCDVEFPSEYLDEELTKIYNEARNIYKMSSRAAVALMRHILEQMLIKNFPSVEKCGSLSDMLNSHIVINKIGRNLVNVGNNIRIIANKLIHTNEIDMKQVDINMPEIFKWINTIANVIYNDYSLESNKSNDAKNNIVK